MNALPVETVREMLSGRSSSDDAKAPAPLLASLVSITACSAIYGATIGILRSPEQAFYTAAKFPSVIICTLLLTGALNLMCSQIVGLNINLIATVRVMLLSYFISTLILSALAPILLFLVLTGSDWEFIYEFLLFTHFVAIAAAGVCGVLRLQSKLEGILKDASKARLIVRLWLTSSLFVGGQMAWLLRPFIGSDGYPVQFLRPDATTGNFIEGLMKSIF